MSEAYLTNWLASQPAEHHRFHEVALHEARIATEARQPAEAQARATSLLDRALAALRGPARIERCDCAVAA